MPSSSQKKKPITFQSISDLNKFVEKVKININTAQQCRQYCKSANDVYRKAETLYQSQDEENAYILFMRYFHIVSAIKKSYEFSKSKGVYLPILKECDAAAAIGKAEKLQTSLDERYQEKTHEFNKMQNEKKLREDSIKKSQNGGNQTANNKLILDDENLQLPDVPDTFKHNSTEIKKPPENASSHKTNSKPDVNVNSNINLDISPIVTKPVAGYISVMDLYSLLKEKKQSLDSILIVDVRSNDEYTAARFDHECMINIPENLLQVGATINSIERKLSKRTWDVWVTRHNKSHLIIADYDFDDNTCSPTCPAYILQDILCHFEGTYHVLIVSGGFKEWHLHFPSMTTNPTYSKMPNTPILFDPMSLLEGLTYPELPSDKNSNVSENKVLPKADVENGVSSRPHLYPNITAASNLPDNKTSTDRLSKLRKMLSESMDEQSNGDSHVVLSTGDIQIPPDNSMSHVNKTVNKDNINNKAIQENPRTRQTAKDLPRNKTDDAVSQDIKNISNNASVHTPSMNPSFNPPSENNIAVTDKTSGITHVPNESANIVPPSINNKSLTSHQTPPVVSSTSMDSELILPKPPVLTIFEQVDGNHTNPSNLQTKLQPGKEIKKSIANDIASVTNMPFVKDLVPHEQINSPAIQPHIPPQNQPQVNNIPSNAPVIIPPQSPATYTQKPGNAPVPSSMPPQLPNGVPMQTSKKGSKRNTSIQSRSIIPMQSPGDSKTQKPFDMKIPNPKNTQTSIPNSSLPQIPVNAPKQVSVDATNASKKQFTTTYGLPYGWEKAIHHETGRIYYKDHNTQDTHWTLPPMIQKLIMDKSTPSTEMNTELKIEEKKKKSVTFEETGRPTLKRTFSSPNLAEMKDADKENKAPSRPVIDRSAKPKIEKPILVDRSTKPISASRLKNLSPVYGSKGQCLTGLKNLGNTCYMNSVIQCLSNTIPLAKYFNNGLYEQHLNLKNMNSRPGEIARELAFLVIVLSGGQYRAISPIDFKAALGRFSSQFCGYQQQDSHELLMFLLDGLHEDVNKVKTRRPIKDRSDDNMPNRPDTVAADMAWKDYMMNNNSVIVDLFQGQFRSTVVCLSCGTKSKTFDAFNCLQLEIPTNRSSTLGECITSFTKPERIGGNDSWKCSNCKCYRTAEKIIEVWKLPPILIVQLKRFHFDGRWRNKIQTAVNFPVDRLNMDKHTVAPTPKFSNYHLYGVINHYGSFESGHYTAYSKNTYTGKWHCYDDNIVKDVTLNSVKTSAAYLLFYTAVDFKEYIKR